MRMALLVGRSWLGLWRVVGRRLIIRYCFSMWIPMSIRGLPFRMFIRCLIRIRLIGRYLEGLSISSDKKT
jgi:hypothetical protein